MTETSKQDNTTASEVPAEFVEPPLSRGRSYKIGPVRIPPWRSPIMQIVLVGFVCFLCPGMFNALGGMGGAGQLDETVNAKANTALYSTFAVIGFCAGTFNNYFGAKATLASGGIGYALYAGSFLSYNHNQNIGFVVFAGAFLGFCAALLWCAQGTVMMSYPAEGEKGKFIGIFWAIFNLGAVIGSIIPIAQLWDLGNQTIKVKDGVYVGFLVLMLVGAALAFFLVPPEKIIRKDGTRVQKIRHPSAWAEISGLWNTLFTDTYIVLLFPFFLASNWFYTYQQNSYNLFFFDTRTKPFNGLWYWCAQIVGALLFGFFLDNKMMTRRQRAIWGWVFVFVVVNAVWGGGIKPLTMSKRPATGDTSTMLKMDVTSHNYTWYVLLYVAYGFLDSVWQTYAYWLMGALSNDPQKLSFFAGFYKGIQSAGAAIAWGLDTHDTSYAALFGTSWAICGLGLICAIPVVLKYVHDTEITAEDFVTPAEKGLVEETDAHGDMAKALEVSGMAAAPTVGTAATGNTTTVTRGDVVA